MNYYIIAGENSGDLHGASLMQELKVIDQHANFRFWGGDKMKHQGGVLVKHYKDSAFMGLWEVIKNLKQIKLNLNQCKIDILKTKPDVLILIDYPGFNLRIAEFAKKNKIKVHYYIAPKVWAWNTKRVYKIKENIDNLYSILPFEIDFFKKYNVKAEYVGNPLVQYIKEFKPNMNFKAENNLNDSPIIALLPGSRKQELEKILPIMVQCQSEINNYQFVIAATNDFELTYYNKLINYNNQIKIVFNQTYDLLSYSDIALVTSGTATLETALFNVPQIVCYKTSKLTYMIAKLIIKIKYISLVNLILDKEAVNEQIQDECNKEALCRK